MKKLLIIIVIYSIENRELGFNKLTSIAMEVLVEPLLITAVLLMFKADPSALVPLRFIEIRKIVERDKENPRM